MKNIRRILSKAILKGPVLAAWNRRKVAFVERTCLKNMVTAAQDQNPLAGKMIRTSPKTSFKKLLLIADVMWETNELVPELERLCTVETLDLHPVLRASSLEEGPEIVVKAVQAFFRDGKASDSDAVLFYLRGKLLSPEVFAVIRAHCGGPIIGLNLDDKATYWPYACYHGGGDDYRKWINHFDLNVTNSRIASTWYENDGANVLYIPPAMRRPVGYDMPAESNFAYPLSFVGSPKPDRVELISRLQQLGISVALFGKGWPQAKWVDDPVKIFRASQINLGFGLATPHLATVKNRDFECPGTGACYLTTYNWELAEQWEIGREILCYRNTEELVEMICWFQKKPELCLKIAQAAWKRAKDEHTWECRFRKVFRHLGFLV